MLAASAQEKRESGSRDELLRWHLRTCVLANMRGLGERMWQDDEDEDEDNVGTMVREGPRQGAV